MFEKARRSKVLIVGSGGNAMSVAVRLQEAGETDVRIISKHGDFGGAWYQNTYPGCGVDGPVTMYQFSYHPSADWSSLFATQPELLEYFRGVGRHYDLYAITDFHVEMLSARWDDDAVEWVVHTNGNEYRAQHLVLATGFLDRKIDTHINGMESFEGRMFHSVEWPEGYTGAGERVAVIGTGSSALQIVPALQNVAHAVTVFQRTPTWITAKNDRPLTDEERAIYRSDPEVVRQLRDEALREGDVVNALVERGESPEAVAEMQAEALAFLHEKVTDPSLRAHLTPTHRFNCKRPGVSDDYYVALCQENTELVPEAAHDIGANTISSTSGRTFEVDTIVLATGFFWGTHILERIQRRDGVTIAAYQEGSPRAYKSISVADCPNLYLVGGPAPNGRYAHGLLSGEYAGAYIAGAVRYMEENEILALEVREEAEIAWKAAADRALADGPALSGDCVSYILDATGRNAADWPGTWKQMEEQLGTFDPTEYFVAVSAAAAAH